ncbi:MAG TPA: hypothetical protein VEG38_19435 [Acidimicrobiia bacterium]|nr:hypothetical protein [Acidimicrobiia bacterium]
MRPSPLPLLLVAGALLLGGCARSADDRLVLDGRPRHPDAEGVVEEISFDRIILDGGRSYGVAKDLQSFSTYDLAAVPMLHRLGQYVHLGLNGKKVEWMAGIGVVVRSPAAPPVVYYNGVLVRLEDDRAIFRDGTVLRLADGVTSPVESGLVRAELDPSLHRVRAIVLP